MSRNLVILDSAKEEFKEIKTYVKRQFGETVWNQVNDEYKAAFKLIKSNPQSGSPIEELKTLGINHVQYRLVKQTRIVYEFDDNLILIHMFISTKRDFTNHLMKRLFNQ
ncbi:type II toxin-antitoxin system RelE/ParE family toxin [Methylophilus sp. 'Pure River']|uniref:type II toxin-antitoxin system RelE/ParE family toxin n=1 Tax=Methylophilus sp. 'Pure River' TaxID=3377117 RepID=UPI00398F77CD